MPFLEKVQDYCIEHKIPTRIDLKKTPRARKAGAPRERASDTKRISYDMFRSGKSVKEIAEERQLSLTTVETHLSHYITIGDLDVEELVAADKRELIEAAANQFGRLGLKQIKDHLPEEISYGEIRMTIAALNGRDA